MKYIKLTNCKYCNTDVTELSASERANHSRWCLLNPKRIEYARSLVERSKQFKENQFTKARRNGTEVPSAWNKGMSGLAGTPHTAEAKEKIRQGALNSNHRRLVRSIRNYTKTDGTVVQLDSSWEEALAIRLDSLSIEWVRPEPMKWVDSKNRQRNYFPDFYLTKLDLYLDPKNPAAYKQQIEKVTWLKENVNNLVFLLSIDEIKNFTPR